jgi:hypothetical protein
MAKMKLSTGKQKQKDPPRIRTVSDTVVLSCHIASLVILVVAVIEAYKQFQLGNLWVGIMYIAMAIAGVLFSFFSPYGIGAI